MALKDVMHDIEGYDAVLKEIEIARRYGIDYTAQQGKLKRIMNSLHPDVLRLRVSEVSQATPSTKVFRLVAADGYLPPFQAGQYINLCVELGGVRTSRPYSIASPPSQTGYYGIAVRAVRTALSPIISSIRSRSGTSLSAPVRPATSIITRSSTAKTWSSWRAAAASRPS